MFTGLVEDVGIVEGIEHHGSSVHLAIASSKIRSDLEIGDSIAVNGVCLTAVRVTSTGFVADAVPETVRRTNLSALRPGDPVNLERALQLGARLGGHLVSGHVDGVGAIRQISREGIAHVLTIECGPELTRYIVEKGSITVDGVSLTVMRVTAASFSVSLIPHSAGVTILGRKRAGELVNLETDLLAKYVEKLLKPAAAGGISLEMLRENGFL